MRILLTTNEDDLKILKALSEPVGSATEQNLCSLKKEMIETMNTSNGIGLAAPQVGISKRIIVIKRTDGSDLFMVNPVFIKQSTMKKAGKEGCLSVPSQQVNKLRSRQVTVQYRDALFQEQEIRLGGRDAVVLQHEVDHLNGTLIGE